MNNPALTENASKFRFGFGNRLPMVLQIEAAECGLACLAMISQYYGHRIDLATLRQRFPISLRGVTLKSLGGVAALLKLSGRPLKVEMESLDKLTCPCVLHWDMNHFVVLESVSRNKLVIHDPAVGVRSMSYGEFSTHFTGIALELTPTEEFEKKESAPNYSLASLMGHVSGLKTGLMQVMIMAIALEITAMVTPFYAQLVIDEALVAADRDLLSVLAIGFVLLALIRGATSAVRGWVLAILSTNLNYQWLGNVFSHLLKLPQDYFEKRHLGDIVSRFGSVSTIQRTLTTGFIQVVVDGLLVVGTMILMLIYSIKLSSITIFGVVLYGLVRWLLNYRLRSATTEQLIHIAKQQNHFYETTRGIQCVRLFGRSEERRIGWLNMLVEQFNSELDIQKIGIISQTVNIIVFGIERVLIIWLGALMILRHEFSVGMLFAFTAYKDQFALRISGLIDKLFELNVLRIHGERVADIVFTERERSDAAVDVAPEDIESSIHLRGVSFRYSSTDPLVLDNVNLSIQAGECIAITGTSGCGKTTLAKLMLGLIAPVSGEIFAGNWAIERIGMENYRQLIGTVMQDDTLFTGSIADNISFFSPDPDHAWIRACAKSAAIHDDIMAMPMGYNSLIGNIGGSISGGQKQRILLARALYSRPKILILDEATSHLDINNEQTVNETIKQMKLTRIVIAHRPETIAMANRVIVMEQGKIVRDFSIPPAVGTAGKGTDKGVDKGVDDGANIFSPS